MVCSKMTSSMFVVATLLSVNLLSSLNTHAEGSCSSGDRCLGSSGYCSGGYTFRPTCVGGYCRCSNIPNRDYCTCLSIIGSCHITKDNSTALGTPTFSGQSQTTYSCVANENCRYNVHVIGNYEGNGRHGFGVQRTTGRTNVNLRVSGPNEGTKPLILVFVSYEPVTWILSIPNGVVIERILLGSYYLDDSSVTGYSSQSVLNVERLPYQTLPYGIGSDTGGGRTDELLEYVIGRFGPVASFSGSYRADSWTLNIQQNLLQSDCQQTLDSVTEQVHITTSSLAATNPTPSSNSETSPSSTPAPDSSPRIGDVRLSGGRCSGNLEIYVNALPYGERWYQICGRNFGDDEAEVVCRQLGCSTQNAVRRQASFGFYAYVFYISQGYDCTGSESSLSRCSRTSAQCILNSVDYGEANDHIAIRCQNPTPPVPPSVPTPSTSSQAPPSQQPNGDGSCSSGDRCVGSSGYCSGGYTFRPTCVDGYCRCSNIPNRDYCTCLSIIGNCHITKDNSTALGIPTFRSQSQTTYSCVANENCQYNVHVIGNYEGNGRHGFGVRRTTGRTNVNLRVSGPNEGTKPLILVFVSYEPVTWILSIPNGVVIERILLGSYYLDDSSVTGYSSQSVLNVERLPYQTLPNGFGSDIGGGRTDELLEYIIGRFGPVASFSGSYRADSWTLNIQQSLFRSDCRQPEISRPGSESISQVIGDVQLSNECSGELQMYESLQSGQGWYSICESSFSDANSKVVCRNLGCSIDGATSTMRVSQSFLPSTRAHIYCYGYESSLSHCELTNMSQCSSFQSRQSVHIECSSNNGDTLKEKTSKIAIFFIFTVILAMM